MQNKIELMKNKKYCAWCKKPIYGSDQSWYNEYVAYTDKGVMHGLCRNCKMYYVKNDRLPEKDKKVIK